MGLSIAELEQLTEGMELEAKAAQGRDGRGEVPASFYETYSAMANTDGGQVLLGVEETPGGALRVRGIVDVERVLKALWDALNNRQKVSACLPLNGDVEDIEVEGKHIVRVRVPRATRKQRPVFVNGNPLTGTFRRNFEGDYRCTEEEVRRMLAEQVEDERDGRVLAGYDARDLDSGTIARYRQNFKALKPDHPWNGADEREFLRSIGAWQRERASGAEGLTAAGLLMFGKLPELREQFPYFMLDYQERPEAKTEPRWIDRVTLDGTWSGNLYDFYHLVITRLFRDLKVPFRTTEEGVRVEETAVHQALREALVNTLIHADYTGRVSLLVVKRPDMFGFRNPGAMRLPVDAAVRGGVSDCRNRRLQAMFRYVGLGEQAGSGLPKIYASWRQQQWRAPELTEETSPNEQTVFQLRMASLVPSETVASLEQRFGAGFNQLSEVQRLALIAVALERSVTHSRLSSMTDAHSRDVTLALYSLVQKGMLESSGQHKRTFYFFPGERPADEATLGFSAEALLGDQQEAPRVAFGGRAGPPHSDWAEAGSLPHSAASLPHSDSAEAGSLPHSAASLPHSDSEEAGSLPHSAASLPHSDSEEAGSLPHSASIDPEGDARLESISAPLRGRKRLSPRQVEEAIVSLCAVRFLEAEELARLTGRSIKTLRANYLAALVQSGRLRLRYPENPTHPHQAYAATLGAKSN